jgi:hypothetical protein
MSKAADTQWVGKNRLPPTSKATIPPYKTPRQLKMKQTSTARVVQDVVYVTETEHKDSDSEDETQFGVVWEKFVPEEVKDRCYPHDVFIPETEVQEEKQLEQPHVIPFIKGIKMMSEREADECARHGEVLNWSPDSEEMLKSASKDMSDSEEDNIPFSRLQEKMSVRDKTATTKTQVPKLIFGEACIGHLILKQFETGVFKGTVMTATKQRGRYIYHVIYEDGDSEDMNDKELLEGHEMYNRQTEKNFQTSTSVDYEVSVDYDKDSSRGDTEGSEYGESDEEPRNKIG